MPGPIEEAAKKLNDAVADTKKTMEGVQQRLGTVEEAVKGSNEAIEDMKKLREDTDSMKESITELGDSIKALSSPGAKEDRLKHDPAYHSPKHGRHFHSRNAAADFCHQVRAGLFDCENSQEYCDKHGIPVLAQRDDGSSITLRELQVGGDKEGGLLITEEAAMVIWDLIEEYGNAANEAMQIPMSSPEKRICLPNDDIEVFFLDELEELPKTEQLFRQVLVKALRVGAYAAWSEEFEQDAAWQGELLVQLFARAFARKMDECVLIADGTSDYGSMVGLFEDPDIPVESMDAGDTDFNDIAYDYVIALMHAVSAKTRKSPGECSFWCHPDMNLFLASIVIPGTETRIMKDAGASEPTVFGYPVKNHGSLNDVTDSGAGKKFLGFGSIRKSYVLGIRMALRVKISRELLWKEDATAIGVMARMGGRRYSTNHFATLKTADS